jgi:hypothetical protein
MKQLGDLNENCLLLEKINNINQNFKKLFLSNNSIIYKNCKHLEINIDNTITKITFVKCKNIKIELSKVINGIEIINSTNIEIHIKNNCKIYNFVVEKSTNVNLFVKSFEDLFIDVDNESNIKIINN